MRAIIWVIGAACACGKGDGGGIDKGGTPQSSGVRKISEAEAQLDVIAKKAKAVFAETGKFPVGTSKVLPARDGDSPAMGGCCGATSGSIKCPVSKDWTGDPVWKALDFAIGEPSNFRYKYTSSDGAAFVVTAAGDLDCDGQEAVYTLQGTASGGKATVELVKPPHGVY